MTSHTSIEIGLENCKTFTPSYEREEESTVPFSPPSLPEKFLAGILTATVWTGIIFTLPGNGSKDHASDGLIFP